MDIEDLKLKQNEMIIQQQQWHDEFIQRENHWFWQKGFWLFMSGAAIATLIIKSSIV